MTRPRLAVLRALGLGDLLTAVPALRALRRHFPQHEVVLLAPAALGELAVEERLVDRLVDVRPWQVPRLGPVDLAVNLHGRGPQSHRLLQALGPARLLAFGCADAGHRGPQWRAEEHEVHRWCRLLAECGIPADPADLRLRLDPPEGRNRSAVVHPGAAAASRRWPAERFAAVVDRLVATGWDVAVTAGPGEADLASRVAAGRAEVLREPSLPALADRLQHAGLLVVGDTGVGHLATACGTPSVRLFGPVRPDRWGPTIDTDRHVVLWKGGSGDPHGDALDPALAAIDVDEVLVAAERVGGYTPLAVSAMRDSRRSSARSTAGRAAWSRS